LILFLSSLFVFFLLGVLILSWYPPDSNDENGDPTDYLVPTILDKAHKYNLKVLNICSSYNALNLLNKKIVILFEVIMVIKNLISMKIMTWNIFKYCYFMKTFSVVSISNFAHVVIY
jgi:hypothetical protein